MPRTLVGEHESGEVLLVPDGLGVVGDFPAEEVDAGVFPDGVEGGEPALRGLDGRGGGANLGVAEGDLLEAEDEL